MAKPPPGVAFTTSPPGVAFTTPPPSPKYQKKCDAHTNITSSPKRVCFSNTPNPYKPYVSVQILKLNPKYLPIYRK
eukprot:1409620-Ditylum_brightwellii.AAC.1